MRKTGIINMRIEETHFREFPNAEVAFQTMPPLSKDV